MLSRIRTLLARTTPFHLRKLIPLQVSKHLYFQGKFKARFGGKKVLALKSNGHQIENEIYWRGFEKSHEGLSVQIWVEILREIKPKNVWDVGANSGTYGLLTKAILSDCNVSFFEPIPKAIEMIHQNLSLNEFEANVFQLALGDFDGMGKIYFPEGSDFETSVTVNCDLTPLHSKSTEMQIQVNRAETIIDTHKVERPNLIKLDVETFEPEVLMGFGRHFPDEGIFLIEILSDYNASKIQEYFPREKYTFFNINDQKNTFRKTEVLMKSDFYNYVVIPNCIDFDFDRLTSLKGYVN